jgi:hypothetical protein
MTPCSPGLVGASEMMDRFLVDSFTKSGHTLGLSDLSYQIDS